MSKWLLLLPGASLNGDFIAYDVFVEVKNHGFFYLEQKHAAKGVL